MSHHIHTEHSTGEYTSLSDEVDISATSPLAAERQTAPNAKICCVCGENVAGRKRYKDAMGKYWCEECARVDSMRKHPAACGDCQQMFAGSELVEEEGVRLCRECAAKRQAQAKRAAARKAAIEEEVRQDMAKRKRLLVGAGVVTLVAVVYGLVCLIL